MFNAKVLRFLFVGTISYLLYTFSFALLWKNLRLNYELAVSIAYVLSVILHFFANRYFTFKDRQPLSFLQLSKYLLMLFINYLITLVVMFFAVESLGLTPYLGIVLSIGATVGISYLLSNRWIFQPSLKT